MGAGRAGIGAMMLPRWVPITRSGTWNQTCDSPSNRSPKSETSRQSTRFFCDNCMSGRRHLMPVLRSRKTDWQWPMPCGDSIMAFERAPCERPRGPGRGRKWPPRPRRPARQIDAPRFARYQIGRSLRSCVEIFEEKWLLRLDSEPLAPSEARRGASRCTTWGAEFAEREFGSSGWTRTNNPPVNSRMLCH